MNTIIEFCGSPNHAAHHKVFDWKLTMKEERAEVAEWLREIDRFATMATDTMVAMVSYCSDDACTEPTDHYPDWTYVVGPRNGLIRLSA